jgi:hypothetical protein
LGNRAHGQRLARSGPLSKRGNEVRSNKPCAVRNSSVK